MKPGGGRSRTTSGGKGRSNGRTNGRGTAGGRQSSTGTNGATGALQRIGIPELVTSAKRADLVELYQFWSGSDALPPAEEEQLREEVLSWMADSQLVEERISGLGRGMGAVVEHLIGAPNYRKSWEELSRTRALASLKPADLEDAVAALQRRGLVVAGKNGRSGDARIVAMPSELVDGLIRRRQEKIRGIFGVLTLRGHLEQVYSEPSRAARITPQRLRELYKTYAQETASVARVERLPEGVRGLIEKAILEFGGVLPKQLFDRTDTELPHWNPRRWRMILEQSLVGTVQEVDLTRYGIQLQDEVLIVFSEVALAWLRKVAVPGDPDRPHEELSLGIDLTSNVSRFLAYLDENDVRFTVRGEIFKTTEKKILQHLIPNPERELAREDVLGFIFGFCKETGLIDRTGKRTFSVSADGREWGARPLVEKRTALLEYALGRRQTENESFHMLRMRPIFMRLFKRVDPGTWYDLMYLPFLARNAYLSTLDDLGVEEHFAERSQKGGFPAMEDPQRLAWNLVGWVRKRLYLLGMIDLGYDKAGRPVALRLTPGGARVLGLEASDGPGPSRVGQLVVTPDFQIVLFPTGDDAELVHALDRFCSRERLDSVMKFELSQGSIRRALKDGMSLSAMLEVLEAHSRTPVPQNVLFSIRDWARNAGLMRLGDDLVLRCEDPDALQRFLQDPGTRGFVVRRVDRSSLQLQGRGTPARLRALLRELGYLVELERRA